MDLRWSSGVSTGGSLESAAARCLPEVVEGLGGEGADLLFVFASAHFRPDYHRLPDLVRLGLPDPDRTVIVGCSAGGVIGAGREVENQPGLAICAASLPGVSVTPFHIQDPQLPDADAGPGRWVDLVGAEPADRPHLVVLADPMTIRAESLLMGLDFAYPRATKVGGLASGGGHGGGHALFLGDRALGAGAVGVAMSGDVAIDTIVAQGCRPIGEPLQVTAGGSGVLAGLDGRPALEVLTDLLRGLPGRDQQLARHSLFLGLAMDAMTDAPAHGDFLIRNIIGVRPDSGAIGVGAEVREGQTVQFHLRDAESSAADLRHMLSAYAGAGRPGAGAGALMFSCLGRGSYLYGRADHDTDLVREHIGPMALTGFFCNGEIGPVGGTSFLHGYTTALGLVRPASGAGAPPA